jgi:hypothetical protein
VKLRVLARRPVDSPRVLSPTRDDIWHVKRFLDETANDVNRRIGTRLADVLSRIHTDDRGLFDAQDIADAVSRDFGFALTIGGQTGKLQ